MKLPIIFIVKPRLFALLTFGFIIATIIGTLSHEAAHLYAAKYYGLEPELHYASVSYGNTEPYILREFDSVYEANKAKILSKEPSPEKEAFIKYREKTGKEIRKVYFNITLAGPLQTILTGTLGVVLLWLHRKKIDTRNYLKFSEWLFVLLAFFWSRQLANSLIGVFYYLNGKDNSGSDEGYIASHLDITHWIIDIPGAILATIVILYVVFRILPIQHRFTFLVAGLAGSVMGWIVWMEAFGPVILP